MYFIFKDQTGLLKNKDSMDKHLKMNTGLHLLQFLVAFGSITGVVSSSNKFTYGRLHQPYRQDLISAHTPHQTIQDLSMTDCGLLCLRNTNCKGFNLRQVLGQTGSCDIVVNHTHPHLDLTTDVGSVYYEWIPLPGNVIICILVSV